MDAEGFVRELQALGWTVSEYYRDTVTDQTHVRVSWAGRFASFKVTEDLLNDDLARSGLVFHVAMKLEHPHGRPRR